MKKLVYLFFSMLAIAGVSCSDFLEENPKTKLSSENIYNNKNTANGVLVGAYGQLAGYNGFSYSYMHLLSTTSGLGVSIKATEVDMGVMQIRNTNKRVSSVYETTYGVIKSCNDIIEGMKSTTIDDDLFNQNLVGEAKFIRAVQYFNLVRLFGPVPLVLELPTSYETAQEPREDVEKVYEQIITDLDDAFEGMTEPGKQVEGHPHKYAAKALLAKVYMTLAGDDSNSENWQKSYDAALDVYTNGGYSLVKPYSALFGSNNNNNAESIFEVQEAVGQGGSRLTEMTVLLGYSNMPFGKSWGKTRPSKYLFGLFDANDPRRDVSFIHTSYVNNQQNKEYLLYPTIKGDPEASKMKYKVGDSEYPAWKKYIDPMITTFSNCNFVYLRFTDVVLTLAEAANELNKKDESIGYINEILDRARDTNGNDTFEEEEIYPMAIDLATNKEDLRDVIIDERIKELTGECDSWYTLRRRGSQYLEKTIKGRNEITGALTKLPKFVYHIDEDEDAIKRNMLLPFPQNEINRNEKISSEEQNYGY